MSLQPKASYQIPQETSRIAKAVFPHGNIYMQIADAFDIFYEDADFANLLLNADSQLFLQQD